MNLNHTGMHLSFLKLLRVHVAMQQFTSKQAYRLFNAQKVPPILHRNPGCVPLSSKPAVRWGRDQRWGWPGSIYPLPHGCLTTVKRCPDSPAASASPGHRSSLLACLYGKLRHWWEWARHTFTCVWCLPAQSPLSFGVSPPRWPSSPGSTSQTLLVSPSAPEPSWTKKTHTHTHGV